MTTDSPHIWYFCPTFLKNQVLLAPTDMTVISVVGQIGSLIGGTALGYVSTFFGRQATMLVACVCGAALVPAYTIPRSMGFCINRFADPMAHIDVGPRLEGGSEAGSCLVIPYTYQEIRSAR